MLENNGTQVERCKEDFLTNTSTQLVPVLLCFKTFFNVTYRRDEGLLSSEDLSGRAQLCCPGAGRPCPVWAR